MRSRKTSIIIIVLLSLAIGVGVFAVSRYKTLTLSIEGKTTENGVGYVFAEGVDPYCKYTRTFKLKGNDNLKKIYEVTFPANNISSLRLAPLASKGNFEIDRIMLENGTVKYTWFGQGMCTQQSLLFDSLAGRREFECSADSPTISILEDSSVSILFKTISKSYVDVLPRIAVALIASMAFCFGGLWLIKPVANKQDVGLIEYYSVRAVWLLFAAFYVYQFYTITQYSMNVPFNDEWYFFAPGNLSHDFSWRWMIDFSYGVHRIALTKLLTWLNLKLFGLDFALQKKVNYIVFGCLLWALAVFKNKVVGRTNFVFYPLFMFFLLSPIASENHMWALQSDFHFFLLFSVLALTYGFSHDSISNTFLATACAVMAMYSLSAGVVAALVYLIVVTIYLYSGITQDRFPMRNGIICIAINWLVLISGVLFWFQGYKKNELMPPHVYPFELKFWVNYFNIVSSGFGFDSMNVLVGIICFSIFTVPLIILLLSKESRWQESTWRILSGVLVILAVLASITVGRANTGVKFSRYTEVSFLLIPYTSLAWWLVLEKAKTRRVIFLSLFWVFVFIAYLDTWSSDAYRYIKQEDIATLKCMDRYYQHTGDGACAQDFAHFLPVPLPSILDRAKELGVTFTK